MPADVSRSLVILDDVLPPSDLPVGARSAAVVFIPEVSAQDKEPWHNVGCQVVAPSDLITHEIAVEAKRAAPEIMRAVWQAPIDGRPLGEQFMYRGIFLADVAHAHLVSTLLEALVKLAALDEWLKANPVHLVWLPRELGAWSRAGAFLAEAHGIPIRRLRGIPRRRPFWPPTRRSLTQWLPHSLRRWQERREAGAATRRFVRQHVGAEKPPERVDLIAVGHYVSECRALVPIVRALDAEGIYSTRVLADAWGRAPEVFDAMKVPYETLQRLGGWRKEAERVRSSLPALVRMWEAFLRGEGDHGLVFRHVPIHQLMRHAWRAMSDISLRHDCIRMYLWWIEIIAKAFDHFSPRLALLADEAMPINVIQVELAHQRAIATICMQHGAMPDHPKYAAGRAARILVGGEALRRLLVSRGTAPERVAAVGIPHFDPLADHHALARVPVRKDLGLPEGMPLIVYTMLSGVGVTPRDEVIAATREVLDGVERLGGGYAFVFKRHPADRADILSRMGADLAARGIIATIDAPIHPLLWSADLVITQMSTTGQEAIMLEKPLIVVNLTGKPDTIPYVEYGAALGVYRCGELAEAMRRALNDEGTQRALGEGRKRFIADFAYRVDGRATERVLAEIRRLVT